jgi:hypothetical protein
MPDMSGSRSPWRRRSVWRFCVNGGVGHCTRTTRVVHVPTCRVRARLRVTEGGSTPDADRQFGVRPASGVRRRHHAGVSRALTPRLPGGSVPVATSQPMAATWALITLAMPRPTPGAAAHTTASGHENRALVGSNTASGDLSLQIVRYAALMSFEVTVAPTMPTTIDSSFHIRLLPTSSDTRRRFTPGKLTVAASPPQEVSGVGRSPELWSAGRRYRGKKGVSGSCCMP